MKKLILSIAVVLALTGSAFANYPVRVNERAVVSFQKEFHHASEVSWTETNNFIRASFMLDKQFLTAYYDYQGNLIGIVKNILTSNLPSYLSKDIKKNYPGYWVSELFQVSYEDGVNYYIELKNADETIVLSTEGTNTWHKYLMPKDKVKNL